MLKMTNVELELLNDSEMVLMIEKGIRGGISQCTHRYAKANNKYMKVCDKSKSEVKLFLFYIDTNNLYGWAMSQYLPTGGFKWVNYEKFSLEEMINKIKYYNENFKKNYIFMVDLKYPKKLHDLHTDLPLAPHHYNGKLMCTLNDKEKYLVHLRNLKMYFKLGMEITKIHKVLMFDQTDWLKKYIDYNTACRAKEHLILKRTSVN
jgi:hypothetical protein